MGQADASTSNGATWKRPPSGTSLIGSDCVGRTRQLCLHHAGGERRRENRTFERRPQVDHRADVVFVRVRQNQADVVLPDLRFIIADRKNLVGLVLTHAHEDHIGAVIDLWPSLECPIFATPFTAGMVKTKLGEYGRTHRCRSGKCRSADASKLAPFDVEFVSLTHSIPEPSGLAIRTPAGLVFHTGDWKLDSAPVVGRPPDEARLKALGDEGVLAMVGDSTNAMREGRSPSEADVGKSLTKIIAGAPRCVAVTGFASNVARLASIAEATRAAGRTLVVAGRALHRIIEVATETGYLPKNFTYLDQQRFSDLPRDKVVVMCTGSQGEVRAAVARIAADEHPDISLDKGDLVSSHRVRSPATRSLSRASRMGSRGLVSISSRTPKRWCTSRGIRGATSSRTCMRG